MPHWRRKIITNLPKNKGSLKAHLHQEIGRRESTEELQKQDLDLLRELQVQTEIKTSQLMDSKETLFREKEEALREKERLEVFLGSLICCSTIFESIQCFLVGVIWSILSDIIPIQNISPTTI